MKRILTSLSKRQNSHRDREYPTQPSRSDETLELTIVREMTAFCEPSAPNSPSAGNEFLHLPAIVDAAESSPAAAREAANCIGKYLTKGYTNLAYAQYNAVMLMRILTDNPGRTFTRNMDTTFVKTVKELLREGKDLSVQQILRETLDAFATEKADNETLTLLLEMWKKEKAKSHSRVYGNVAGQSMPNGAPQSAQAGNHFARQHRQPRSLPAPGELAGRIEEAKTTAKLLSQTVQSTPSADILNHDLIKELADRASSASRGMQGYIHTTNPAPDEDTMLTLIETNDQLSFAMSKHQRALLQARRTVSSSPPAAQQPQSQQDSYAPSTALPPGRWGSGTAVDEGYAPPAASPQRAQDHVYAPPLQPPPQHKLPTQQGQQQQQQAASQWDQTRNYQGPDNPFADEPYQRPVSPEQPYGLFSQPNQASSPDRREQDLPDIQPLQPRTPKPMAEHRSTLSYPSQQDSARESESAYSSHHLLDQQGPVFSRPQYPQQSAHMER